MRLRQLAAVGLAATAAAGPAALAQADDDEPQKRGENIAVATTEKDNARAFDMAWSLERQRGGAIEQSNVANAAARCTDCRATAIAFQVVIVEGKPSVVKPRNQAVAINDKCTRCVVYAGARQFVRVVPGPVRFTGPGRKTLQDVRSKLRALEGKDQTAAELASAVEAQEARVTEVLAEQLVTKDGRRTKTTTRRDRQSDDD